MFSVAVRISSLIVSPFEKITLGKKRPSKRACVLSIKLPKTIHQPRTDCKPARRLICASCGCYIESSNPDNYKTLRTVCCSRRTQCNSIQIHRGLLVPDVTIRNTGRPAMMCSRLRSKKRTCDDAGFCYSSFLPFESLLSVTHTSIRGSIGQLVRRVKLALVILSGIAKT